MSGRICVAGGPRVGKTTYAALLVGPVRHTDDILGKVGDGKDRWSAESAAVATWFDIPGPWVVEGVTVPRALRKWLAQHPEGKPCDTVLWLEREGVERTKGQEVMAKACATVLREILPELERRGVRVLELQHGLGGWPGWPVEEGGR